MSDYITHAAPGIVTFKEDGDADHYSMIDDGGRWWLALLHNGGAPISTQVENMRRLAACWNACISIPTEDVKAVYAMGGFARRERAWQSAAFDSANRAPTLTLVDLLTEAERFISGFEGDELQEDVDDLLVRMRMVTDPAGAARAA